MNSTEYHKNRRKQLLNLRPGEAPGRTMQGIYGLAVMRQYEVARIMGISYQAVQQIERKALWKLRRAFHSDLIAKKKGNLLCRISKI